MLLNLPRHMRVFGAFFLLGIAFGSIFTRVDDIQLSMGVGQGALGCSTCRNRSRHDGLGDLFHTDGWTASATGGRCSLPLPMMGLAHRLGEPFGQPCRDVRMAAPARHDGRRGEYDRERRSRQDRVSDRAADHEPLPCHLQFRLPCRRLDRRRCQAGRDRPVRPSARHRGALADIRHCCLGQSCSCPCKTACRRSASRPFRHSHAGDTPARRVHACRHDL